MSDTRITKLAQVLIQYSLELQPGEEFCLATSPLADELNLAVYKEALLAGAHVSLLNDLPGMEEIFYTYASDDQLDYVSPFLLTVVQQFSARLLIYAPHNTRELTNVDPKRISRVRKAKTEFYKTFLERTARGEFKWCNTIYPTAALAQEAEISLREYQDFVYGAGFLDLSDPTAAWQQERERQGELIRWLDDRDQVQLKGPHIDLTFSIKGRTFEGGDGKYNFPDGEIATSPVESSANGWVRFSYPGIYFEQEIEDIELWFEDGKVVKERAKKGQNLLVALLNTDAGSRYLGEWGIGTNYGIKRFTKNMLFDEKIGGTIHLAVGARIPQTGGKNESSIHWDMLCDMSESEITIDGALFYKDGKFVV